MPDELEDLAMDEEAFLDAAAPRSTLPENAAKAAGWGMLALFGFVAFIAWRKSRK